MAKITFQRGAPKSLKVRHLAGLPGRIVGGRPGVIGSGGAWPSRWASFSTAGLTITNVGVRQVNGRDVLRLRLSGTTNSTFIVITSDTRPPAVLEGQVWEQTCWAALVAGSMTNVSSIQTNMRQAPTGNTDVTFNALTGAARRQPKGSRTMTAGATGLYPAIVIFVNNASAVDITLDIGIDLKRVS